MSAYDERQKILDEAGPAWRFRCAVDRFERSVRTVEGHIVKHGSTAMPEVIWAEERIARRELMALCPRESPAPNAVAIVERRRDSMRWNSTPWHVLNDVLTALREAKP